MKSSGPYSTLDISDDVDDGSSSGPLSSEEALERFKIYGPNKILITNKRSWWVILVRALLHPFNLLLVFLSAISGATGELKTMGVMLVMVTLSTLLRFVQEWRSELRAQNLLKHVALNVTVIRFNDTSNLQESFSLPADQLVPGDWIELSPGDMIPADVEIMDHKDLHVTQAALTGEPLPVHKFKRTGNDPNTSASSLESTVDSTLLPNLRRPSVDSSGKSILAGRSSDLDNPEMCFLGSAVISGVAICRVVRTGGHTLFGQLAKVMCRPTDMNAFERGVRDISKAFFWTSLSMAGIVFLLQGFLSQNWYASVIFSLSVAVGLTPEMLPMVVNTCLSKGAIDLSSKGCIVKKLEAIVNMGSMRILCTDKTGTLTTGKMALHKFVNRYGLSSMTILRLGYLNARFQSCKKNPLDAAILNYFNRPSNSSIPSLSPRRKQAGDWSFGALMNFEKVDELPFDFKRRRVSVILSNGEDDQTVLICKGAVEEVLNVCTRVTITTNDTNDKMTYIFSDSNSEDISRDNGTLIQLKKLNEVLVAEGFRVIAIAFKKLCKVGGYSRDDESQLTFAGYLAFLDPPKESATVAVRRLELNGVTVKMLSGDSPLVCKRVCDQLGLAVSDRQVTTGDTLEVISDPEELIDMARQCRIFAKLTPVQKADLVKLMQMDGTVVGFLGDGVNDAAALTEADVGIAVDTGTDVAKESSDIIMLNKDLTVVAQAITIGRRTFGNTMKYIVITVSSNFGNVFSILTASAWLPYQPIASFHILIQNLLYDLSQISIPWDTMDKEYLKTCHVWSTREILKFMMFMGPWSSIFDILTFLFMYYYFSIQSSHDFYLVRLFQTTWFTVGLLTQCTIVHIIRTPKWPLIQSRSSFPVAITTIFIITIGLALPFIPGIGGWVQMVPLPWEIYPFIATVIVSYSLVAQLAKQIYLKIYQKWY